MKKIIPFFMLLTIVQTSQAEEPKASSWVLKSTTTLGKTDYEGLMFGPDLYKRSGENELHLKFMVGLELGLENPQADAGPLMDIEFAYLVNAESRWSVGGGVSAEIEGGRIRGDVQVRGKRKLARRLNLEAVINAIHYRDSQFNHSETPPGQLGTGLEIALVYDKRNKLLLWVAAGGNILWSDKLADGKDTGDLPVELMVEIGGQIKIAKKAGGRFAFLGFAASLEGVIGSEMKPEDLQGKLKLYLKL